MQIDGSAREACSCMAKIRMDRARARFTIVIPWNHPSPSFPRSFTLLLNFPLQLRRSNSPCLKFLQNKILPISFPRISFLFQHLYMLVSSEQNLEIPISDILPSDNSRPSILTLLTEIFALYDYKIRAIAFSLSFLFWHLYTTVLFKFASSKQNLGIAFSYLSWKWWNKKKKKRRIT